MKKLLSLLLLTLILSSCSDTDKKIISFIFGTERQKKIIDTNNEDDNISKENNIDTIEVKEKEVKVDEGKKVERDIEKQIEKGKLSHQNLLKEGYKINNLGDIKEYYQTIILNEQNGVYRNQTIYKQGDKILSFGITYAQGVQLEISYPVHKYIDLSNYDNSYPSEICQPILGKCDYKIIITDLDTIKIVNKKKGINKVLWKNNNTNNVEEAYY